MKTALCILIHLIPSLALGDGILLYVPAPRVVVRTYVAAPLAVEVRDAYRATPQRITSVDLGSERVSFAAPEYAGPIRRVRYGERSTRVYYAGGKSVEVRERFGRVVVDYDD